MKQLITLFLLVFSTQIGFPQYSQRTRLTKVDFVYENQKLDIQYDIVNSTPGDKYFVWAEVHAVEGSKIKASTWKGDVGWVESGSRKHIFWYAKADSLQFNQEIFVRVFASKLPFSDLKKGLLYTGILPGYGHKPVGARENQIAFGITAYTAVGASCYFNFLALQSISQYRKELNITQSDQLMNDAHQYWNYSLVAAGVAAGIWAWDAVKVARIHKKMQDPTPRMMQRDEDFDRISGKSPSHVVTEFVVPAH